MKNQKYIVICEMPDGSRKEFVSFEEVEIGSSFHGGKVKFCRQLSVKHVE